jgi:hypothetical protein
MTTQILQALKNFVWRINLINNIKALVFEISHKQRELTISVVCPQRSGLGDTYMICGLCEELMKSKNATSCIVYVKPGHQFIASLFDNLKVKTLSFMIPTRTENRLRSYNKIFFANIPSTLSNNIGSGELTLLDCYKMSLNLPLKTKLSKAQRPYKSEKESAQKILSKYALLPNKTCLIAPEANSSPCLNQDLIKQIYKNAIENGYTPAITAPFSKKIDGLLYIDIPLQEIRAFAECAGWVISVRSGLCDLLSDVDCRLTVLHPDLAWHGGSLISGTSLKKMGIRNTAEEYEINKDFRVELLF